MRPGRFAAPAAPGYGSRQSSPVAPPRASCPRCPRPRPRRTGRPGAQARPAPSRHAAPQAPPPACATDDLQDLAAVAATTGKAEGPKKKARREAAARREAERHLFSRGPHHPLRERNLPCRAGLPPPAGAAPAGRTAGAAGVDQRRLRCGAPCSTPTTSSAFAAPALAWR